MLSVSEELAERDPALSQLAAAAVSGLAPRWPRKPRCRSLLKRAFAVDVETCPRCGGRMRLLAGQQSDAARK